MATFHFDLVSPEKLLFSGEVDQVDVPGSEGDFGVLAGHAPTVSALRPGIMTVYVGGNAQRMVVLGGFAEVSADGKLTVLADLADSVEDFDRACSPSASPRRKRRSRRWRARRSTRRSSGSITSSRSTSTCRARRCITIVVMRGHAVTDAAASPSPCGASSNHRRFRVGCRSSRGRAASIPRDDLPACNQGLTI